MPIQINLLAEAQAAEEMRRRDPVKRSLLGCGAVIALALVWCLFTQWQIFRANAAFQKNEARWKSMEARHTEVTGNLKKSNEIERKLAALARLSTNRFLLGSALNALQQTMVDKVQAMRLKTDQVFTYVEPVPAKTNSSKVIPGKPAAAIEKVAITIEAKDWRPADQNYNKYKEAIAKANVQSPTKVEGSNPLNAKPSSQNPKSNEEKGPSAQAPRSELRLTSLSKPTYDPSDPVAAYVTFTLELQLPEIRRNE
ncbi:MAG: hypothetical protein ABIQ35_11325 [Verrucomicrobiota bacterium]